MDVENQNNNDNHGFQNRRQRNFESCSSIQKTRNVLNGPAMAYFHFKVLHLFFVHIQHLKGHVLVAQPTFQFLTIGMCT